MVVTQKDQVVTGETAVFDTKTNLVTMLGGVVLTQRRLGCAVIGCVDMTTGVSRVEIQLRPRAGPVSVVGPGRLATPRRFALADPDGVHGRK